MAFQHTKVLLLVILLEAKQTFCIVVKKVKKTQLSRLSQNYEMFGDKSDENLVTVVKLEWHGYYKAIGTF